jgi:magnesium transporter
VFFRLDLTAGFAHLFPGVMHPTPDISDLNDPVVRHAQASFVAMGADKTVQEALDHIRATAAGGSFIYFYVVDAHERLCGVLQVRKLLTAPLDCRVATIMDKNVIAIPESFTLLEACEFFVLHKFLAFPVVDQHRHILGVVDINLFTKEMFDLQEQEQIHSVFETLGVRVSELRNQSPWHAFRTRFPWLLGTITSGMVCAVLVGLFEVTLAQSLVLAFFLTLVLGLGESVAMQTMAIAVHLLHHHAPRGRWYGQALRRELTRTLLLALACAAIVGGVIILWRGEGRAAGVIAAGILAALLAASFMGVSIPTLLHRLRLDLRVASGPVTLALTDIATIAIYFSLAALLLGH